MWRLLTNWKNQKREVVLPKNRRAKHLELGAWGEGQAIAYLKQRGYKIVATNFTAPIGRSARGRIVTGEIDIVAYDDSSLSSVLVFVEVKTRTRTDIALPEAAVDLRKQRQIIKAGRVYKRMFHLIDEPHRYDVVSVIAHQNQPPIIEIHENYFSEERFYRSHWYESYR